MVNSLIESGEWSKQDADKIAMNAGAGINGKIEKTIPGALKFISPVDVSLSAGAEAGVKFDSNTTDTLTEKLGDNKTKALENALNRQLAEKALSSDKVSSSFTNGQSSGTSASLVKAAEAGKAYSDALQVSNSINNNDLSGAIRQRAEQLAMEDGLRLNISGEMELHQKYGSKAFSQMIQESQSFNSLQNNINTTPNSVYNAGAGSVNVANHHAQSKAEVERFENQSTNSFNQKSAQEISKEWQDFFDSKNRVAKTIQSGARETGPANIGVINDWLNKLGVLPENKTLGEKVGETISLKDTSIKGKLDKLDYSDKK